MGTGVYCQKNKIRRMAKVLGLKQLASKKYAMIAGLSDRFKASFGELTESFKMIVWGESANGKSNFLMQFLREIMHAGKVLYVSLEEGTESTMQTLALRHLNVNDHSGKIEFADEGMNIKELIIKLKKKKSPKIVVIDSVQYWDIGYPQYKELKTLFPRKAFIFISHANGKLPDGTLANKIRYDVGIKVRVEGFIAFVTSRYGGNKNFVIEEKLSKKYWQKKYRLHANK
jgi:hypothetical protein